MIETAYVIGLHPAEFWELELWEFHACIKAYNRMQETRMRVEFARVWQAANLTGAAFGGKLKKLEHYLPEREEVRGRRLTQEQMDDFDRRLRERGEKQEWTKS